MILKTIPISELKVNDHSDEYEWDASGDDPAFEVLLTDLSAFLAGSYRLLLHIKCNKPAGRAKLYLDTGNGFSENETVCLPFINNVVATRVFSISRQINAIRFDPFDCPAHFSIHQFEIEPITIPELIKYCSEFTNRKFNASIDLSLFRLSAFYAFYDELFRTSQVEWLYKQEQPITVAVPFRTLPDSSAYFRWFAASRPKHEVLNKQVYTSDRWKKLPLLSIVVPCYNSSSLWLGQLLESIVSQTYTNWECIILDDASDKREHLSVINRYVNSDSRFKTYLSPLNMGVGGTSCKGVELSSGEYVAVVDHDDLLEPDALYEVANVIRFNSIDVIYTDEAIVDESGNLIRCELRPDFSYAMLLSHPYIVHLTFFKREVLLSAGNFRSDYAVSQDYEVLLRVAAQTKAFFHIPKVLYRWRTHSTSTGHTSINMVTQKSIEALNNHLSLIGYNKSQCWIEEGLSFNFFRFRSTIDYSRVRVIIPTKDRVDLLKNCINTLMSVTQLPSSVKLFVTIVDNGSEKVETLEYLNNIQSETIRVIKSPGEFNFSRLNNIASEKADEDYLLFLNNDIEIIEPNWLAAMLELMAWDDVGIVGAKLLYPNTGLIQHGGVIVGFNGIAAHDHQFYPERQNDHWAPGHLHTLFTIRECSAVTAACLLMRRSVFTAIGGFDEHFAVGFGDTDLCLRAGKNGWRCLFTPYARLVHHESASRGHSPVDPHPKDTERFKKRWAQFIKTGDPFYNANLTLTGEPYYLPNR